MSGLIEFKCPECGAPISFDSEAQSLKCPYCDSEFPLRGFVVPDNKEDQVHMSAYADKVFNKWQDSYGNNRR